MIPIEQCKDGYIYFIRSRNLNSGIYRESTAGFTGEREKFGFHYLFEEYHWDTGPPFGTAKPYYEVEKAPDWMMEYFDRTKKVNEKTIMDYISKLFNDWHSTLDNDQKLQYDLII